MINIPWIHNDPLLYVFVCLSYLGEAEMAESICEIYKGLANPQSKRNTLKDIVEKMTGDSIEKRYYFRV